MVMGRDLPVTPFVGVWIETLFIVFESFKIEVTPFVGVWIETGIELHHLSVHGGHTLRGCVD